MKPAELDALEKRAEEQASDTKESTSRAADVLSKFRLKTDEKRKLLEQYAAQDAALKKKKAAKGV